MPSGTMPGVLMIAFHYPPARASGSHRALAMSRYLPEMGWKPIVLTTNPDAFPDRDSRTLADIPASVIIHRSRALDTVRHLAIKGRYFRWMAIPDRWTTWRLTAIPAGIKLIKKYAPQVIWSTYPIATSHLIAHALHEQSHLPWVADLRDPMLYHPEHYKERLGFESIEKTIFSKAVRIVVVTPGMADFYHERYPDFPKEHLMVIRNGYDHVTMEKIGAEVMLETVSEEAESDPENEQAEANKITLVHSGYLYPQADQRDPIPFFDALAQLCREGTIAAPSFIESETSNQGDNLSDNVNNSIANQSGSLVGSEPYSVQVILRASGHEERYEAAIKERNLSAIVQLKPALGHRDALDEMARADGLLLFQGSWFNHQVPAKLYEYLGLRRPIFAMATADGASAEVLRTAGFPEPISLNDVSAITEGLRSFFEDIQQGSGIAELPEGVQNQMSRQYQAKALSDLFNEVVK